MCSPVGIVGSYCVKRCEVLRSRTVVCECCYSCHKIHFAALSVHLVLQTRKIDGETDLMPSICAEYNMECNKKGMLNYLYILNPAYCLLWFFFFPPLLLLFKWLGQASVSAEKVTQERNVIVAHLGIGASQTACAVTAAWLVALMKIHAQNLVFAKWVLNCHFCSKLSLCIGL